MKTDLKVQSFSDNNGKLSVCVVKETANVFVTIGKDDFEAWLIAENKLEWEDNHSDHAGNHVQTTGKMSLSEYWVLGDAFIHSDLMEYMASHPIIHKRRKYFNTLQFLNDQFKKRLTKKLQKS